MKNLLTGSVFLATLIVWGSHSSVSAQQPAVSAPAKNRGQQRPGNLPGDESGSPLRIAKVNPDTAERARQAAAHIDSLVAANYQKHKITPNPLTTDEQFVRRIYLDITGTIPNYDQTVRFLKSNDPDKRTRLIDQLLNSSGYASHEFNFWAHLLRLVDNPNPYIPATPYINWIKQSIRDNKPYDVWAREMITAEGKIWDNPAAGYVLRDAGMPLDAVTNTARLFLGTQIGCAQCHDHPFDRWKQREFYELAAYSYGLRTRSPQDETGENPVEKLRQELMDQSVEDVTRVVQLMRANTYAVKNEPAKKLQLPHDYQYDDGKPGDPVEPKPIFDGTAAPLPGESPRETFARWLTAKDNPRFAKAVANRYWKRAFGVGLIEPVDDIRDESVAENPELLDYLTKIVVKVDFDLKELQRIIFNTQTYQRQASTREVADGEVYHFPGPVLRRMTAEQVWDSLLTLAVKYPDGVRRPSTLGMADAANIDLDSVTANQVLGIWEKFDAAFGYTGMKNLREQHAYNGQFLARASEQLMPAQPGHFLREFGQGDRELIEGASIEGTVPQILTMFNGPITHMMLEDGSVIFDNVVAAKSVEERVDVVFLSLLSRKPTGAARAIAEREIESGGPAGYGDVIWALLNTREFLFIQ